MRNPNGYGGASRRKDGRRRKPIRVRVTIGYEYDPVKDRVIQKYKELGNVATKKEAAQLLADYNAGIQLTKQPAICNLPTFADVYEQFSQKKFAPKKKNNEKGPSASTIRSYRSAYDKCEDLWSMKMINIRPRHMQAILDEYSHMSKSTVSNIKKLFNQMYKLSLAEEYVTTDYSVSLELDWTASEEAIHAPFSRAEIATLWKKVGKLPYVDLLLMMIYSGVRPSEFVEIETANVHLEEGYVQGGLKTDAGRDRIIPIHSKVLPFWQKYYNPENQYFLSKSLFRKLGPNERKPNYSYCLFVREIWDPLMEELDMDHLPHDPRHTFSTLMDRAGANDIARKRIMGHTVEGVTGVYTHKDIEDLKEAIELL